MNRPLRAIAVLGIVAAASLPVACTAQQTPTTAAAAQAVTPPIATPIVTGLPDFTALVKRVGPAVVNISAEMAPPERGSNGQVPPGFEDFLRQFGVPMPGNPGGGPRGGGTSLGSGFVISEDGYVLTNNHVIEGADEVTVTLSDRREFTAKVVGSDEQYDIALLKIEADDLSWLRAGDSHTLQPGQWVVAIGSPFGLDHSVTAGIVSAVGRSNPYAGQQYVPFIQTDVAINRGNSGGPLLNTSGEVVGINSQIFSNSGGYMGVSFAIPIEVAMNAVRQIQETGKVQRGQLGVQVGDVQREQFEELGLTRSGGAFVGAVQNDSAAARAGIRAGDVILAFNGKEIGSSSELPPLVGAMPPGSRANVKLLRDGKKMDVVVVLEPMEDTVAAAGNDSPRPSADPRADLNPIGVVVGDLDPAARSRLGLKPGEGVRISRVASLAARQAGLQPGDVILQVGRTPVGSAADFETALKSVKSGDRVRLLVRNNESTGLVTLPAS